MKRKTIALAVFAVLVIGAVAAIKIKQKKIANLSKPLVAATSVQVAKTTKGSLEVTAHYLATIEPLLKSDLSPRISGNILSITKREGDLVRQGELLATIDDRELQDRTVAVQADLLATKQKLAGAQSSYVTQKSVYGRDEALFKAGAISKEALERSRAALDGAKAVVDAYEESLKGLAMNTSMAKTQAGYAKITAPFSGVVSKRWAEPGDLSAPGKPILTIEKTSSYKVLAQLPQEELRGIRPGSTVELSNGSQVMTAKVNRVYPSLGKNMLATVEVLTSAAPFGLPSSATVGFDLVTKRVAGILAPAQAVVKSAQGSFVYQVKDGIVHIIPIKVLGLGSGMAALEGNIEPGAVLAVAQENKLLTLTEGSHVAPAEPVIAATPSSTQPAGPKPVGAVQ